jgi:hypothetical protein
MADPQRDVEEFKLRLGAHKSATALFLAGHAAFIALAFTTSTRLAFGSAGACYMLAGAYIIVRRRFVQPTADDHEGLSFAAPVDAEAARRGARTSMLTGVALIAFGLAFLAVAFDVVR